MGFSETNIELCKVTKEVSAHRYLLHPNPLLHG